MVISDDGLNQVYMLENVQGHIERAKVRARDLYYESLDAVLGVTAFHVPVESPIEAIFLMWWQALQPLSVWESFSIQSQFEVQVEGRTRRLDFVLAHNGDRWFTERANAVGVKRPQIAIELDGHDFHERTRAQVIDRNARDRHLQVNGWTVFHFSGSEVNSDPEGCVIEVMEFAWKAFQVYEREIATRALAERPGQP